MFGPAQVLPKRHQVGLQRRGSPEAGLAEIGIEGHLGQFCRADLVARSVATRDRLMAAGRTIVADGGMAALRTEEVVLRAGTAKGTFFAHFPDRDHFLAALLAETLAGEFAGLVAPTDRAGLLTLLEKVFTAFAADGNTVALLARFSGPVGAGLGIDLIICGLIERLAEGLAKMQVAGQVSNLAPPEVLAEGLVALTFHAAASAQCAVAGDQLTQHARAGQLLQQMTKALVWPPR